MKRYVLKRILWMIPVALGVAILIFTILYFTPGDPAVMILGSSATLEDRLQLRTQMGLEDPYIVQLLRFLKQTFLEFNLGTSYFTNKSVAEEIISRFPNTFYLAFGSMVLSCVIGIPLGITAAVHQNRLGDRISMVIALIGISMPAFWVGLLLVMLFSLNLGWLPPSGIGSWKNFILPIIATSLGGTANLARLVRSSMLDVIRSDYVTTARAKGVNKNKSVWFHALPNALIPVITQVGTSFGKTLGGTIVVETVFGIPGIGNYMLSAVNNRDYPIVQGCVVFLALAFSIVVLLVDIIYAYVDPRIKAQYEKSNRGKSA
ncbi:MAG: ABC transporter permease [Clostridia bacterium]|nr:ABC transporter permease [Clostridia bacterium]